MFITAATRGLRTPQVHIDVVLCVGQCHGDGAPEHSSTPCILRSTTPEGTEEAKSHKVFPLTPIPSANLQQRVQEFDLHWNHLELIGREASGRGLSLFPLQIITSFFSLKPSLGTEERSSPKLKYSSQKWHYLEGSTMPQSLVGAVVPAAQGLCSQLGSSFAMPTLPKGDPQPHTGCAHPNPNPPQMLPLCQDPQLCSQPHGGDSTRPTGTTSAVVGGLAIRCSKHNDGS